MELHLLFESSKPIFGIGHRRNIFLKIQSLLLWVTVEGEIPFPRQDWAHDCRPEVAKQHDIIVIMMVWKFLECNEKSCLLIYKRQFSNAEWSTVIDAKFPGRVPLITDIHICKCSSDNQVFKIDIKKRGKEGKCASCNTSILFGDLQASTEGPYGIFNLMWIKGHFISVHGKYAYQSCQETHL